MYKKCFPCVLTSSGVFLRCFFSRNFGKINGPRGQTNFGVRGFASDRTGLTKSQKAFQGETGSFGVSCCQGKLKENEDRCDVVTKLVPGLNYFAVFDGHRGHFGAEFLQRELAISLAKSLQNEESLTAHVNPLIENSFESCEHMLEVEILANDFDERTRDHIGTTALVALISNKSELLIAQTGDSRAILCRSGNPICLVDDHSPNNEKEANRIEEHGGWIDWDTKLVPYVNGILSMTRSFGNIYLRKSGVNHIPYLTNMSLDTNNDQFLVLCTDGVSDWMTDEEIVAIVTQHDDPQESAEALTSCARQYGSTDDASAIVVALNAWKNQFNKGKPFQVNFLRANVMKRD